MVAERIDGCKVLGRNDLAITGLSTPLSAPQALALGLAF